MDSEKNTHILQPGGGIAIQAAGPDGGSALPGGEAAGWLDRARSFFLLALISLALFLTWRPGVFRLSLLFSLGLPPLAESLAWQPPPAAPALRPQANPAPSPAEWRLAANRPAAWLATRPEPPGETWLPDASPPRPAWRRFSYNPWNWRTDRSRETRRAAVDSAALPSQKSVPALRIGDLAEWPAPGLADSPPDRDFFAALLPIPTVFPEIRAENGVNAQPAPIPFPAAAAEPGREVVPAQDVPAAPVYQSPPIRIDWRNREITGPIADAYLTIYPKLKFVGLCVPGQGYIRKYNQVAVPADLLGAKVEARDGRSPYGRYYIADRHRDIDGPRLFLSWPSPEDARRIGLDPGRLAQVDNAWRQHRLPPQDSAAGGGVGLNGLRNWVETTEGGFALEAPHMEEIFTALPDGAWVFIQP